MRNFFSRRIPTPGRILLIESGSREVLRKLLPRLPAAFGDTPIDIVTCYAGDLPNFPGRLFNINEYGGPASRERLLDDLVAGHYQIVGLLCTGEPIMTKWKCWLAWKLPAKVFIVNENADLFWCDRAHLGFVWALALDRAGLSGGSAAPTLARLVFLPVSVAFLLAYAATVHLARILRTPRRRTAS